MSRGKTVVGIAVLFALALSAFAAAGASANGTTAYTCVKDANGDVVGAHCLTSGGGGQYEHVEIKQEDKRTITAINANTAEGTTAAKSTKINSTVAGVATKSSCASVRGEGTLENKTTGKEMYFHSPGEPERYGLRNHAACRKRMQTQK